MLEKQFSNLIMTCILRAPLKLIFFYGKVSDKYHSNVLKKNHHNLYTFAIFRFEYE